MLWKASETVSEGNVPIPQQEDYGSDQPTLVGAFRQIKLMMTHFEEQTKMLEKRLTTTGTWRSAATSCHGGRRTRKH